MKTNIDRNFEAEACEIIEGLKSSDKYAEDFFYKKSVRSLINFIGRSRHVIKNILIQQRFRHSFISTCGQGEPGSPWIPTSSGLLSTHGLV